MTQDNPSPPPPPPPPPPAHDPGGGAPPPPPPPVGYESGLSGIANNPNARTWGMIAHLSALIGLTAIPSVVGPLVVWLVKKDEMPFVNDQAKEALNFHLTVLFALIACSPLIFCFGLGLIAMIGVGIAALIFTIIAAVKANECVAYRYPLTLRLIK